MQPSTFPPHWNAQVKKKYFLKNIEVTPLAIKYLSKIKTLLMSNQLETFIQRGYIPDTLFVNVSFASSRMK